MTTRSPQPRGIRRNRPSPPRPIPAPTRRFAALGLLLLAACAPEDPDPGTSGTIRVTDGTGRPVVLDRPARRVVSLMPATAEWIIAMGGADRLAARTDFDDHPAVASLPSVGGGLNPSVEWLAARRPDLVFAWPDAPSRSLVSRLEDLGIPVYTAPVETIDEALAAAEDVGRLLGLESAAESAIAGVRAGLDSVAAAVDGRPRPAVLFLIGLDPLMAAGPGTFVDELIARAGGRNVLSGTTVRWPQLSLEEVVRRGPAVVIVGSAAVADPRAQLGGRPGWRDVPAVRAGRVHGVDPDFVNRPGPHLDEAAARLAALIHTDRDDPGSGARTGTPTTPGGSP